MRYLFFFGLIALIVSCQSTAPPLSLDYQDKLDEILHDDVHDGDFQICNSDKGIFQYFNDSKGLKIEGEESAIDDHFKDNYKVPMNSKDSGLVRIRFVVNCKGESGRFRVLGMDWNYKEKQFDLVITGQLLELTKSLKGWGILEWENVSRDYYQYLLFRIEKGAIQNILP